MQLLAHRPFLCPVRERRRCAAGPARCRDQAALLGVKRSSPSPAAPPLAGHHDAAVVEGGHGLLQLGGRWLRQCPDRWSHHQPRVPEPRWGRPDSIGNLRSLTELRPQWEQLLGATSAIGNLTNLTVLDCGNSGGGLCGHETTIHEGGKVSTDLVVIDLSSNRFSGFIPSSVSNLTSLHVVNLFLQCLRRQISMEIGQLARIE
ncbi:hypothetical protein ZWY2020_057747 [Hordeum vulgare]|nr:hypothetical protein ZWY2020_057747 [Hordeum vulgare]